MFFHFFVTEEENSSVTLTVMALSKQNWQLSEI